MKKFNFEVDQKVTMWHRSKVEIEANSLEEAQERVKNLIVNAESSDIHDELLNKDDVSITNTEYMEDTVELITLQENDGASTVEVMYDDEVFFRNAEI